jgi:hypothetical protein
MDEKFARFFKIEPENDEKCLSFVQVRQKSLDQAYERRFV